MNLRDLVSRVLRHTPLGFFPVRVKSGPAKGARWTLGPYSSNWRYGGEGDLAAGFRRLSNLSGASCWDFGAHFGIHTLGMALQVGNSGQVAAFEPDPVAFQRLQYHVSMNRLMNVRLFPVAVSDSCESKDLIISWGLGTSFSHFRYEDERTDNATKVLSVKVALADRLVASGDIFLPDLIKVDVQGHGAHALAGSMNAIRRKRPIIIFSNHSKWELEGTQTLLTPLGYKVYSLNGDLKDWHLLMFETAILACD